MATLSTTLARGAAKTIIGMMLCASGFVLPAASTQAATLVDQGNVTLDTATNLQWLDLSFTAGLSFNMVTADNAAHAFGAGWRYATAAELGTLFTHAGGSGVYPEQTVTSSIASNGTWSAVSLLADLLGSGHNDSSMSYRGLLADAWPPSPTLQQTGRFFGFSQGGDFTAGLKIDDSGVLADSGSGLYSFLVRDNVVVTPVPTALPMFGVALAMLSVVARRRRRQ